MPFEGKLTSCLVGVAMALSPYAMVTPGSARAHCDMEGDHPGKAPDHKSPMGCHAACMRDDETAGKSGRK